jgi:KUP system potassium uptake protein
MAAPATPETIAKESAAVGGVAAVGATAAVAPVAAPPVPPEPEIGPYDPHAPHSRRDLARLCLLALGVVYGDIGTSPLYALRECFFGSHPVDHRVPANVLGVLSLVFWLLLIIVSVKYLVFVLRADNQGEGGIMALMALLAHGLESVGGVTKAIVVALGLFGGALLFGDGIITPAISVLSAVEGLEVATPVFQPYILPITIAVIVGLFLIQRHGSATIGSMFGPIMFLWFTSIALLGLAAIVRHPQVLGAISPHHAVTFFVHNGWTGFLVLGTVVLVVTGAEALYADMGHFGPKPIRIDWYYFVLPALLLNYFGQGAMLLRQPVAGHAVENTFYALVPPWALYPMVVLATVSAAIASQAVISGVFSIARQTVQLGYMPRMAIEHTSARRIGQIYVPQVNTLMLLGTLALVVGFGESSDLAAAYGVAVTLTMVITTLLLAVLTHERWGWKWYATAALCVPVFVIELALSGANIIKVTHGGWVPLALAFGLFAMATTWKRGRQIVYERFYSRLMPIDIFIRDVEKHPPHRVKGTAVFMTGSASGVPLALMHNLKHNQVLHERIVMLTVQTEDIPHVPHEERLALESLGSGFHRVVARYGFMEEPDMLEILQVCGERGLAFDLGRTTFFLGHETLVPGRKRVMWRWRSRLFALMSRNALPATTFFHIPPNRVVEVGTQIEM